MHAHISAFMLPKVVWGLLKPLVKGRDNGFFKVGTRKAVDNFLPDTFR